MTLATIPDQPAPRQGELVLPAALTKPTGQPGERSREPDDATATCQAVTGPITPAVPNRAVTALVAAPNAASTSRHGDPVAFGTDWSTPANRATTMKCTRAGSSRAPHRRSQPRTVSAGTPSHTAIRRCPRPAARAVNAAPITSAASARRSSTVTGSSTCVTRHPRHRARRGRSEPTPRTRRGRAHPHGASTPSQPGQSSSPVIKRDSTRT
jgi:hypothetical protein